MLRSIVLSITTVIFSAASSIAQDQPLDLVPADAIAAIVVRNLEELKTKGDKLYDEAKLGNPFFRPSQLFAQGVQFLGVQAGFDTKSPTALLLIATDKRPELDGLVAVVPFTDREKMAGNFGLKKDQLPADKIIGGHDGRPFSKFLLARGNHVFMGEKEKAVAAAARRQAVSGELSPSLRKSFNSADILIHLGTAGWADEWRQSLKSGREQIGPRDDPAETKMVDQFFAALGDMRFGLGGIRVDRGVGLNFMPVFARDKDSARKFLTSLAGAKGRSDLKGLADGNIVFAQALRGGSTGNAVLAKVLFDVLLRSFVETRDVLSALDRPVAVGFLTEVLNRVEASRAGLYLTPDESKLGLFSLVAILDTEDPGKFLSVMKVLARIVDGTGLDLNPESTAPDRIDIAQLIKDLGDRRFRVRESATLKLRLLGEPALSYLEKARAAGDLEVSRRATRLRDQIAQAAAERRKDLLEQNWLRRLQPTFAFIAKAEKRGEHTIDVVRVKLTDKDRLADKPLRQFFGPEWRNVRLAVQGKQIVVLLGSDLNLLETTLKNLDNGAAGLETGKALQTFQRIGSKHRNVEFHIAMDKIMSLVTSGRAGEGRMENGSSLTSLAVALDPDHVQLDVWIPAAEFGSLSKGILR